jgi:hypothetical protein
LIPKSARHFLQMCGIIAMTGTHIERIGFRKRTR